MDGLSREGKSVMMIAAGRGQINICEHLLSGVHPFPSSMLQYRIQPSLMSALDMACRKGHVSVVRLLLEHCPNNLFSVHTPCLHQWLPIHFAASQGHVDVCRLLLEHGTSLVASTADGSTPLHLACSNKMFSTVQWLIEHPSIMEHINDADQLGLTPLHRAARQGEVSILRLLIENAGADPLRIDASGSTPFEDADRFNMTDAAVYLWRIGVRSVSASAMRRPNSTFGSVRWIRPRILDPPEARFHVAACALGSTVYVYGGVGYPKGLINHDPENRIPESVKTICHSDMYSIDLDDYSLEYVLPISDSSWTAQRQIALNSLTKGRYITLLDPYTTVYDCPPHSDCTPCIVKASEPFRKEFGFGYFEVHIVDLGSSGVITIGLTDAEYPLERKQPGWESDSYALHGDDGAVFHNSGNGKSFCEPFHVDDVIGCGINWQTNEVFFTRNGRFLGVAYRGPRSTEYWATVGMETRGTQTRVNFGSHPFHFGFQIPTLRWKSIPSMGKSPPPLLHSRIVAFSRDRKLLLLPDHRYSAKGALWTFNLDSSSWARLDATGPACAIKSTSYVAVIGAHVWIFNPKESNDDASMLFRLDTLRWRWDQISPIPAAAPDNGISPENLRRLSAALLGSFSAAAMVKAKSRLHFFSLESLLSVHPITLSIEKETTIMGYRPRSSLFSTSCRHSEVVTFGGWDDQKQRADTYVLDLQASQWYKPHISSASVLPRPRNLHVGAVVSARTSLLDRDDAASEDNVKQEAVVQMFGWNGRNCMDDFDVLIPTVREDSLAAEDLDWSLTRKSLCDLTLLFPDDPDSADPLSASKIILACRSSRFRLELQHSGSTTKPDDDNALPSTRRMKDISFEVRKASQRLFNALLHFLYTDQVDLAQIQHDPCAFVELVHEWAPEHERKIIEEIALTMVREPSRHSRDMIFALQNPLFSDLTLIVDGRPIVAHKSIICSRSSYFRGLCLSGLRESREKTIPLADTSHDAFLVVLEYIYTRKLNFELLHDNIVDVFMLSCRYSLRKLKSELESIIASNLTPANVCSILLVADQHDALQLRKSCANFISQNLSIVRATPEFAEMATQVRALVPVM
jgi:ankyrin repeat protein